MIISILHVRAWLLIEWLVTQVNCGQMAKWLAVGMGIGVD